LPDPLAVSKIKRSHMTASWKTNADKLGAFLSIW
jgi:hypothetical protein